jgi:fumarylpyruvate hydrolase
VTSFVFPPPAQAAVAVAGQSGLFPVRRIYCVGRNYVAHIREMGGDERAPPFFFQKPTDSIVPSGATVPYPAATSDFQYEIELVLALGKAGRDIPVDRASEHVFGLAVGIDLTRRDLQLKARDTGRPWEAGKGFDQSAPISAIHPLAGKALPTAGAISLSVNGQTKQSGDLSELIWSCAEIVSHLSKLFDLEPGDLIYTGTPSGVGKMVPGDLVEGRVEGVDVLTISIGDPLN